MGNVISTKAKVAVPSEALYVIDELGNRTKGKFVLPSRLHNLCKTQLIAGCHWIQLPDRQNRELHTNYQYWLHYLSSSSALGKLLPSTKPKHYQKLSQEQQDTLHSLLCCSEREIADPGLSMKPLHERMVVFMTHLVSTPAKELASITSIGQSIYHFMLLQNKKERLQPLKTAQALEKHLPVHEVRTLVTGYAHAEPYPLSTRELRNLQSVLAKRHDRLSKLLTPLIEEYTWSAAQVETLDLNIRQVSLLALEARNFTHDERPAAATTAAAASTTTAAKAINESPNDNDSARTDARYARAMRQSNRLARGAPSPAFQGTQEPFRGDDLEAAEPNSRSSSGCSESSFEIAPPSGPTTAAAATTAATGIKTKKR
jgi:hypothetical protein